MLHLIESRYIHKRGIKVFYFRLYVKKKRPSLQVYGGFSTIALYLILYDI